MSRWNNARIRIRKLNERKANETSIQSKEIVSDVGVDDDVYNIILI